MFPDLSEMTADCFPTPDLPFVLARQPPAHIVAAIPLKPSARIVLRVDPSLFHPDAERLAGMPAKKIQRVVVAFGRKLCARKPTFWKFALAIGHILAAENAEREHFLRRKFRLEVGMKIPPNRFRELVRVPLLEGIVHPDRLFLHMLSAQEVDDQQEQAAPPTEIGDNEAYRDFLLPDGR